LPPAVANGADGGRRADDGDDGDGDEDPWRGVTRVVFEWSFTKDRRLSRFRAAVARLEARGFTVMYEGRGVWEALDEWPWHKDALVFAARHD